MARKRGFLEGYKTYDTSDGFGSPSEWRAAFKFRMGIDAARARMAGKPEPYEVLCIPKYSDWLTIRAAWKRLILRYHPDMHSPEADNEKFLDVQAAYEVLENAHERAKR